MPPRKRSASPHKSVEALLASLEHPFKREIIAALRELILGAVCDHYRLDPEASDVWFVKRARATPDSPERSR